MIRVMIAEDELPLLRGLKDMVENLNDQFQVVMSAKNGKEAIEYLKENQVDVIFTDINMPMVDGIGVLKYVSENFREIQAVVISGYDDFSYAQQAIKYKAINYLLKPVDRTELKGLLNTIELEFAHYMYNKKQKILSEICAGYQETGMEHILLFNPFYVVCFCAGSFATHFTEEVSPGNAYWEQNHLKEIAGKIFGEEEHIFCFWGKGLNERILMIEKKESYNIQVFAEAVLKELDTSLPVLAAFQDTAVHVNLIKEVIRSLRGRMQAKGIFGETMVIGHMEQCLDEIREDYVLPVSVEGALQFAVKKGQFEEVKRILVDVKESMKAKKVTQKNLEVILRTILTVVNTMQEDADNYEQGSLELDVTELITNSTGLDQVFADFTILCISNFTNERSEGGRELMVQVDAYIRSHIKMPITTKMLASKFGLVSPYLSRLFKEYKGQTPSQYIQTIRINSAKELLLNYPHMLSKDVAETVGYENPLYFSKTFKKNVGVYPSEYKALYKKE